MNSDLSTKPVRVVVKSSIDERAEGWYLFVWMVSSNAKASRTSADTFVRTDLDTPTFSWGPSDNSLYLEDQREQYEKRALQAFHRYMVDRDDVFREILVHIERVEDVVI